MNANPATQDTLLQLLIDNGALTPEQVQEVREEQERTGHSVHKIVSDHGLISEDDLLTIIANHLGTTIVDLQEMEIAPATMQTIPASAARMYNIVPIALKPSAVVLATSQLLPPEIIDEIRFVLTRDISFVMARSEDIKNLIGRFYGSDNASIDELLASLESEFEQDVGLQLREGKEVDETGLVEAANAAPVVRLVNLILYEAVQNKATDVHFEPFEKEFKIRYRVDGALYEMHPPAQSLVAPVISRIKVLAGMNIAERRLPQNNRIQMNMLGRAIDFRVSTLPTEFGESVVLRILDRARGFLELNNLGMPADVYDLFSKDIQKPNGIIIVTGPTGSGKTTSLYAALQRINRVEMKVLTCEDPVEYDIEGLVQVQVNEAVGLTFSNILRHFVRQDPDIIMIGEIRDADTAQIAIQSSLTGHLVLSTLHTNDAAGAVTRLIDLNVEPFLISSTLEAVLAQRLVRRICQHCKTPYQPDAQILDALSLSAEAVAGHSFYYGKGCPQCHDIGYAGQKGLYEYLTISNAIRELINQRKPTIDIRNKAIEQGMRLLRDDGLRNIYDGHTTVDEVLKYTSI